MSEAIEYKRLDGFYRGEVVDNNGALGKVKIFVPGVYPSEYKLTPDMLPYAEPAMGLFGGNYIGTGINAETGICIYPKIGATLWLFFDQGNWNFPIYFAGCQAGTGWFITHNKQYGIQTDNVRITIDEKTEPRVDIQVKGNVNIKIVGNVTMQVDGNVTSTINGNKTETINGKTDITYNGDVKITRKGNLTEQDTGNDTINAKGNMKLTRTGKEDINITGQQTLKSLGYNATIAGPWSTKAVRVDIN